MTRLAVVLLFLVATASAWSQETPATVDSLKRAARESFQAGDPSTARNHLQALLETYRRSAAGVEQNPHAWSLCLADVGQAYLRGGLLADAMRVLGEAADLHRPALGEVEDGLAPAAAGLHRRLAALDAEERYQLLHDWSMPAGERPAVRVLTSLTPTDAPPSVFARALGERPRRDAFPVPEIGQVRGLFCSAWELVEAADQAGRLRGLSTETAKLVEDEVPNARFVQTLIEIIRATRKDAALQDRLLNEASRIDAAAKESSALVAGKSPSSASLAGQDLVIAAACLTRPWLQPSGEIIFRSRLERSDVRDARFRPFLRYAHATAVRMRYPEAGPDLIESPNLAFWIPSGSRAMGRRLAGPVRPLWLLHEDHILHLSGPGDDYLFFKYPLSGEFRFSCETQNGGNADSGQVTDGGLAYGGRRYKVLSDNRVVSVWGASLDNPAPRHCPFVPNTLLATFNHYALQCSPERVAFAAKGHVNWTEASQSTSSPWIGLHADGDGIPFFRNLKLTGNPVIPRQVDLAMGDSLPGWTMRGDWSIREGVLNGARQVTHNDETRSSHLRCQRPLQDGESIRYEFQYQPGELEVHPVLGRIVFLVEPDGVRLRWLTDGGRDWTGLAEDNAVIEPLNRCGPKPLPLLAGEWNRIALALESGTLTLSLNETTIYTRKMEAENERTFGLYHDQGRSEAHVRHIVLRGDWPEALTSKQLENLAAAAHPYRSKAQRRVLGAIFDDRHVHGWALAVHQRAADMPLESRYNLLSAWVLPSEDHQTLRMDLDFTPTNPAPPVAGKEFEKSAHENSAQEREQQRITTGGELVAPALDLVACAAEFDRLDNLQQRVEAIAPAGDKQRRARLSMLALIALAQSDFAVANGRLEQLAALVDAGDHTAFAQRCPETLSIWQASEYSETRAAAREMADLIVEKQIRKWRLSGYAAWERHIRALASQLGYLDLRDRTSETADASADPISHQPPLANWVAASRENSYTRGQGFPPTRWALSSPATIENVASHWDDYLFYRIPLRGNFEVECDVTGTGLRNASIWVAGEWVSLSYNRRAYYLGGFRDSRQRPLDPNLHKFGEWMRHRTVVRDGVCTTYFNGRMIHQRTLAEEHDPWIAIRSPSHVNGSVRNLRITGSPDAPKQIRLSATAGLSGWLPVNSGHQVGPGRKWRQLGELENGGGILGIFRDDLPGSNRESLIRYHRPMLEDGTIEYDFYFRQDESLVHPALDRLGFMLQPDGVRLHWVTDDEYDRTGLAPDNLFDEPDNRRGPSKLPLQPDSWNRLQLALQGDVVQLTLNDQLIYERKLEATNQRTFGLFHYCDRTAAHARNIVWRGDWPRELPSVDQQQMAGEGTEFLSNSLDHLTASFHHDFARDGYSTNQFNLSGGNQQDVHARPGGIQVVRPGGPGFMSTGISPQLAVYGDFDVVAEFDEFDPHPDEGSSSAVYVRALLGSARTNECFVYRRLLRHRKDPQPIIQAVYVRREAEGPRRAALPTETVEATAGRLRVSRRGETVYCLFAENDSPVFRLIGKETATKDPIDLGALQLVTQTQGAGRTSVVWKSLTIRAEKLDGIALRDQESILAKLNQQRDALPHHFAHDFSEDLLIEERFSSWGVVPRRQEDDGLRLIALGKDTWTSAGLNSEFGLAGDFDIVANIYAPTLAMPKEKMNSSLYLLIEFPDEVATHANVILVRQPDGRHEVYSQVKTIDESGKPAYRQLRRVTVDSIDRLRIARRGKRLSFICRELDSARDRVLAQMDVCDSPIPRGSVRLMIHTGGADRQSDVLLKKLQLHAEKLDPDPSAPPAIVGALARQLVGALPAHALEFDGRTQYVTVPSIRYDGSHPVTLEAFVTPDAFRNVAVGDTQRSGIGLGIPTKTYNMHAWNGKGYTAAAATATAARFLRVHLVGTFDGKTLQVFVDGKLLKSNRFNGTFQGSGFPMTIGASPSPLEVGIDYAFDGVIDQVRISKTVRYTQDFETPTELAADEDTLALFQFKEGQGGTLHDTSGQENHGQVRGATWVTSSAIRRRAAQGLAELGRHAVPSLIEALAHDDADVRLEAVAALGAIGPPARSAIPDLIELANDSDTRVRTAASRAIELMEAPGLLRSIWDLFELPR